MQQAGVAGIAARGAPVSFRGVRKTYGAAVALNDFNLEIAAGEFLTLLGPSGSGKTTALNVLAGFIEPSGGDIAIGATSIAPPADREAQHRDGVPELLAVSASVGDRQRRLPAPHPQDAEGAGPAEGA